MVDLLTVIEEWQKERSRRGQWWFNC